MNEITSLLERAVATGETSLETIEADVIRGRRALRRQRIVRSTLSAAAIVGIAGFGVVTLDAGPGPDDVTVADGIEGVELSPYHGQQPAGYEVAALPDGWEIQGATPAYLTIAPIGFSDQDPSQFVGKLLVSLRSPDGPDLPEGEVVTVGDSTGHLHLRDTTMTLSFVADGQHVQVQAPKSLGWSAADITEFALGVEVTSDAEPAQG